MSHCDHCGNECALPFTCQHCGGKFCPECRLPPNHDCVSIGSWNKKPRPTVGMSYGKGGGVTATGGGYVAESRRDSKKKMDEGIPWLKILVAMVGILFLAMLLLVISGFSVR